MNPKSAKIFVWTAIISIIFGLVAISYAAEKKEPRPEYSESPAKIKTVSDIEPEEYEVYAAVFASGKLDGMPFGYVVLEKETLKEKIRKENWKDLDGFMFDDFNRKNEKEHIIENRFPSYPGLTIKAREGDGKRKSILDWDKETATMDSGKTSVSRVGFNKDKTKAFVYVQYVANPEMGIGHYVLLDKTSGKWVITGSGIGRMF